MKDGENHPESENVEYFILKAEAVTCCWNSLLSIAGLSTGFQNLAAGICSHSSRGACHRCGADKAWHRVSVSLHPTAAGCGWSYSGVR